MLQILEKQGIISHVNQCKSVIKKWTNVRDSFNKCKKRYKASLELGCGRQPTSRYVYGQQLQFLKKTTEGRPTEDTMSVDNKEPSKADGDDDLLTKESDDFKRPIKNVKKYKCEMGLKDAARGNGGRQGWEAQGVRVKNSDLVRAPENPYFGKPRPIKGPSGVFECRGSSEKLGAAPDAPECRDRQRLRDAIQVETLLEELSMPPPPVVSMLRAIPKRDWHPLTLGMMPSWVLCRLDSPQEPNLQAPPEPLRLHYPPSRLSPHWP
ncbi:hypothetical protein J437_LFUL018793 [Ladona fulva]|uniref:Uncharacterized protein n=1 Tax=Ladona fulva TaxID=123851 RepID=A0A8K0KW24_LADFU|nr:hypothetical protein J437_LFUL018793 [Ladona fulva]